MNPRAATAASTILLAALASGPATARQCETQLGRGWPPGTANYGAAVERLFDGQTSPALTLVWLPGNGKETGDHQPGFMLDSSLPVELVGNTIANNGGPAISQPQVSSAEILAKNLFSLEGRKGRLEDIRVTRKRTHP